MPTKQKSLRDKYIIEGVSILNKELEIFSNKYFLRKFMSKEDIEDMKSTVTIDMIHAIERFDPSKAKLTTFLSPRLKGAFKDFLRKESKIKEKETLYFLEKLNSDLYEAMEMGIQKADVYLKSLNITNEDYKNICLDISEDDIILNHHLFDALITLPEKRVYILLGYFILDKSVKEIANDLDLSSNSGWVYKLKRQSINNLKDILKLKGVL